MAGPYQGSDINPNTVKSGQGGGSPREYNLHQRHSLLSKRRHDDQLLAFLQQIATELGGGAVTPAVIFAKLTKYPAARVKAATNISQLP